jgi:hypothetical protein
MISPVLMASLHGDGVDVVWVVACPMCGAEGFEIIEIAAGFFSPRKWVESSM